MSIGVDLISLGRIVSDEKRSLVYILSKLTDVSCPFCHRKKHYIMSRKRIRCRKCRRDYNPLLDSKFSIINLQYSKWLALIKLFELSVSARQASVQAKVSYKTALKAFDVARRAIIEYMAQSDDTLRGEIEADEAYFGGRRKGKRGRGSRNKVIVFGILERRKGKVTVDIVDDVSTASLLGATVKKVRRGSIVYTDKWHGYDSLMFSGYKHLKIDHKKRFARGQVYINGIEGFWSFAKERMMKYHGVSPSKFLYYIKEMEWRYNNRDRNLFDLIVDYMLGANHT